MHCCFGLLALIAPRITILLLVVFGDYIGRAFDSVLWPLLGFFLMPTTVLAYALARNQHGSVEGVWLVLVVVAVLIDMGVIGTGAKEARSSD